MSIRWPGVTANLYQRALPGTSMRSWTVTGEPSSRNAFGHESLSRELAWHSDDALPPAVFKVMKAPGFTPATFATK